MTVSTTTSRWEYDGNGVTKSFAFDNRIFAASDLKVYVDGALVTAGYAVSGVDSPTGGAVTFAVAPPAGAKNVVLVREVPATQNTAYPPNDKFPSAAHERALDKLTVLAQQAGARLGRVLGLAETDEGGLLPLPARADRAGRHLAFDADGQPVASAGTPGPVPVTPFAAGLLDDADAAAARATLRAQMELGLAVSTAYGLVPGATTDQAAALQAFLDAAEGKSAWLVPGTYLHTGPLYVRAGTDLSAYGATIKAMDGADAGTTGIHLSDESWTAGVSDVRVFGLTYDGNRDSRTPPGQAAGFYVISSSDVTLRDCRAIRCVSDGFYVGGSSALGGRSLRVDLIGCSSDSAYRNGLSIVGAETLRVLGGSYEFTNGAPDGPCAGIDIEPDGATTSNHGVLILGARVRGNFGDGIVEQTAHNYDVAIQGVQAVSNGGLGVSVGSARSRCRVRDVAGSGNASGLLGGAFGVDESRPAVGGFDFGSLALNPSVNWSTTTTGSWLAVTGADFTIPAHYASARVTGFLFLKATTTASAQVFVRIYNVTDGAILAGGPVNVSRTFSGGDFFALPFAFSSSGAAKAWRVEAQLANAATLTISDVHLHAEIKEAA